MKSKISVVSNLWVKSMRFESAGEAEDSNIGAGDTTIPAHRGHKHKHDHQTILAFGKFKVTVDEEEHIFDATEEEIILFILAGKVHHIESVSDTALAFCVHPIRDGERVEDIIDPASMPLVGGTLKSSLLE